MRNKKVKKTALVGVLFALAMVLSFLESFLTPLLGLPPGVKIGLANVVIVFCLYGLGARYAMALAVLKALFSLATRGVTAGLLSLCGGLLSLLAMALLIKLLGREHKLPVSVCGAIFHNMGQLAGIWLVFAGQVAVLYYFPVLLLSGIGMGVLNWLLVKCVMPYLEKIN